MTFITFHLLGFNFKKSLSNKVIFRKTLSNLIIWGISLSNLLLMDFELSMRMISIIDFWYPKGFLSLKCDTQQLKLLPKRYQYWYPMGIDYICKKLIKSKLRGWFQYRWDHQLQKPLTSVRGLFYWLYPTVSSVEKQIP